MKTISLIVILFCFHSYVNSQAYRKIKYQDNQLLYLVQNNRMENVFQQFPGMSAIIILVDSTQTLESVYKQDSLHKIRPMGTDEYTCFYYVGVNHFNNSDCNYKKFCEDIFYQDFINRNKITILFQNSSQLSMMKKINDCKDYKPNFILLENSSTKNEVSIPLAKNIMDVWNYHQSIKSFNKYSVLSFIEFEKIIDKRRVASLLSRLKEKKGKFLGSISVGRHTINKNQEVGFDTLTLINLRNVKTTWDFQIGYYLTNKMAVSSYFGFSYTGKQKEITNISTSGGSGITVSGIGKAAAILRYGVGFRYIPYSVNRIFIFTDLSFGKTNVIVGGGEAIRTIGGNGSSNTTTLNKDKTNSYLLSFGSGLNWQLAQSVSLTYNTKYNISSFTKNIASVNGYSGLTFNLGLALHINIKKPDIR